MPKSSVLEANDPRNVDCCYCIAGLQGIRLVTNEADNSQKCEKTDCIPPTKNSLGCHHIILCAVFK